LGRERCGEDCPVQSTAEGNTTAMSLITILIIVVVVLLVLGLLGRGRF
jgi:hypothetical protein